MLMSVYNNADTWDIGYAQCLLVAEGQETSIKTKNKKAKG
jgi:hypothetical protein